MKRKLRLFAITAALASLMAVASPVAGTALGGGKDKGGSGGSDQSCSQRGGKNNTVTCKTLISVGDVTVDLSGSRILSDNEINVIKGNVTTIVGLCNATGKDNQACTVDILNVVVDITKSFNNYNLFNIIVKKGDGKSEKKCPC